MQTTQQYFYKSIKYVFSIVAVASLLVLILFTADVLLPVKIHNGLTIIALSSVNEIAILTGVTAFVFVGYKAVKILRMEQSSRPKIIKMLPTFIFWVFTIFLVTHFTAGEVRFDCEKFNHSAKLGGRAVEFNEQKYIINICGSGVNSGYLFGDGLETVQLSVTNEQGDTLVKRRYKVSWDAKPGHEPIAITMEGITYQDDEKQRRDIIRLPPTFLDQIEARFP